MIVYLVTNLEEMPDKAVFGVFSTREAAEARREEVLAIPSATIPMYKEYYSPDINIEEWVVDGDQQSMT